MFEFVCYHLDDKNVFKDCMFSSKLVFNLHNWLTFKVFSCNSVIHMVSLNKKKVLYECISFCYFTEEYHTRENLVKNGEFRIYVQYILKSRT